MLTNLGLNNVIATGSSLSVPIYNPNQSLSICISNGFACIDFTFLTPLIYIINNLVFFVTAMALLQTSYFFLGLIIFIPMTATFIYEIMGLIRGGK